MLFNRQAKSLRKGVLCLAAICLATLGASAQQRVITISNKADGNNSLSVSVSQAMEAIESQTDFKISYNKNQLNTSRILVLKSATVPMDELLQSIANGAGVQVMMQGNHIAFVPGNDDFRQQASRPVPSAPARTQDRYNPNDPCDLSASPQPRSAAESAPAPEQPVAPATTESAKPFYSDFRSLDSYNAIQRPRFAGTGTFQVQAQTPTQNPNGEAALPGWNIKTNLLYDATATINLGVEFRTGAKTSIDIPFNYNAWKFSNNRQWRHFLVQPEFRLWTREAFDGHFFGAHAHYAYYNVGNLPHGTFSEYMRDRRFEGWLAGAGISYGYRWNFNDWLGLEATVGVGYAYMEYDKFECRECGANLGSETKHYFGPTKVGLSLVFGIGGKKTPTPQPVVPLYVPAPESEPESEPEPKQIVIYEPAFTSSFVTPEAEAVKARSETGKAYLDFTAGRSEITPNFKNNASELHKMNALIESVCTNSDATITSIVISGYASPEGTYSANVKLSERRALALRNYIGSKHALPQRLFSVYGVGEDWAGLETLVEQSDLPRSEQVLGIIQGTGVFDGRERQLMALEEGTVYRQMKAELFPQLRRVEYRIDYTVIPFTIEQGKEVMKTRPGDLSLNEMFLIANSYVPGSEEFNEVFETAARVFPDSDVANLNAAAIALNREDSDSAARYLAKVKIQDAAYWNNFGLLQWLQGDKAAAAESFAKAGAHGATNALELDKHLQTTTAN